MSYKGSSNDSNNSDSEGIIQEIDIIPISKNIFKNQIESALNSDDDIDEYKTIVMPENFIIKSTPSNKDTIVKLKAKSKIIFKYNLFITRICFHFNVLDSSV